MTPVVMAILSLVLVFCRFHARGVLSRRVLALAVRSICRERAGQEA